VRSTLRTLDRRGQARSAWHCRCSLPSVRRIECCCPFWCSYSLHQRPPSCNPATVAPAQVARNVRKHLLSLPYYGVFDLITFGVDQNNIVTLGGYVLADTLKKDAEREAREAKGVVEVQNKIEIATESPATK